MTQNTLVQKRVYEIYRYLEERLSRTALFGLSFKFPKGYQDPLNYLGMMTFVVFLIEGLTGALLMFYYEPSFVGAWESVRRIEMEIPFGFMLRNIHYHGSNAMIFLAISHMFFLFFKARYKLRNELIWASGVLMGTVVILEAFFGYALLFNERALLAINIGRALMYGSPVIGTVIANIFFGGGFTDWILKFYALHVFILPMAILAILPIHFPKKLVIEIPSLATITGIIMIVAGIFPVELGTKFVPLKTPKVEIPEWYFTALYAYIRSGLDPILVGVILPTILIGVLLLMPWLDISRKLKMQDRPFFTSFGIAILLLIGVTTVWGFFAPGMYIEVPLLIDLAPFIGIQVLLFIGTYIIVYHYAKRDLKSKKSITNTQKSTVPRSNVSMAYMSEKWINWILAALVLFLVFLNATAYLAYQQGLNNLVLVQLGTIFITFGILSHMVRHGLNRKD